MAGKKENVGAGHWEPVRPADVPARQILEPTVDEASASIPKEARSLFVAPVDSSIVADKPQSWPAAGTAVAATPVKSVPVESVPVDPAPVEPAPVGPAPVRPAPVRPAPVRPAESAAAATPEPKYPVIQYPSAQPRPATGQFSPAAPPQTYEPTKNAAAQPSPAPVVRPLQVVPPVPPVPNLIGTTGAAQQPQAAHPGQSAPHPVQASRPPGPNQQPGTGPAGPHPAGGRGASSLPMSAQDLSAALLVKPVRPAPVGGWRRALYNVSGRAVNLGNSAKDQYLVDLTSHINQPLQGCYKIALLSLKGGVGKTTTTATLGSMFSSIRGDRVIAVDANPDRGTLSQKIPLETPATVRSLLRDAESIEKYSDVRGYTSQSRHRLEVLASDSDPAVSEAFSGEDYTRTIEMLEKFYSIVLTDCGTGLMHSAMQAILEGADSLIVISSGSVDGARSASATLDWLDAHGYSRLVTHSVAVINAVRPRAGKVDLPRVVEHFQQRCRTVQLIPFDPHLEEGAEIDLDQLRPATRAAVLELAAAVAQDFPISPFGFPRRY
ncbi:MinD-like ATPase involved in chromosome partitioning or flagellar assembly [Rhodococcus sp. 27YEA15]|uniref:MinD/ParA family ATP-binding protein n=1 Tax=Rhodococcus sp. 27YEA15 TaxID=3156259 RepID=UPI003C7AE94D